MSKLYLPLLLFVLVGLSIGSYLTKENDGPTDDIESYTAYGGKEIMVKIQLSQMKPLMNMTYNYDHLIQERLRRY